MMKSNKVLLTGIAVTLLATVLPLVMAAISQLFEGMNYQWLDDGNVTVSEVISFAFAALVAASKPVREHVMAALGMLPE